MKFHLKDCERHSCGIFGEATKSKSPVGEYSSVVVKQYEMDRWNFLNLMINYIKYNTANAASVVVASDSPLEALVDISRGKWQEYNVRRYRILYQNKLSLEFLTAGKWGFDPSRHLPDLLQTALKSLSKIRTSALSFPVLVAGWLWSGTASCRTIPLNSCRSHNEHFL